MDHKTLTGRSKARDPGFSNVPKNGLDKPHTSYSDLEDPADFVDRKGCFWIIGLAILSWALVGAIVLLFV